jgi:hypothetical protein
MSRANIQIVHFFDHGYLEEKKSMIHSFTVIVLTPNAMATLLKSDAKIFCT